MSRRRGGLFLPLDVNFMDDELIALVGEPAAWLYLGMCLRAKSLRSDGVLTDLQVEKLGIAAWKKRLGRLLSVADRDGRTLVMDITDERDVTRRYWITGWDGHNDRAEILDTRLEKDRNRKRSERTGAQRPNLVRTLSGPIVEKSKVEKSTVGDVDPSDLPPSGSDGSAAARAVIEGLRQRKPADDQIAEEVAQQPA